MADKRMFILFDGRARVTLDTDNAAVIVTADSESEARRMNRKSWGDDTIWFEYKEVSPGHSEEVGPRFDLD